MQQNFLWNFYGPKDTQWAGEAPGGALRGAQPTRERLGAQAGCAQLGGLPHRLFAL